MINIIVPMAGKGSRFAEAGYMMPKPLIDIHGHYMIEYVIHNLTPSQEHKFIFICQTEHLDKYNLEDTLKKCSPDCEVVGIDYITEGAACTVLLAEKFIDNQDSIMIANSDQYVDININEYLNAFKNKDGLIMTMPANDPKWSYIQYNERGLVTMVREKEVISDEATVGIYNFKQGSDFVEAAYLMIEKNIRVNNEFYVAPVYNELILQGKKVGFYNIGDKMYGLGVPDDLQRFLDMPISKKIM